MTSNIRLKDAIHELEMSGFEAFQIELLKPIVDNALEARIGELRSDMVQQIDDLKLEIKSSVEVQKRFKSRLDVAEIKLDTHAMRLKSAQELTAAIRERIDLMRPNTAGTSSGWFKFKFPFSETSYVGVSLRVIAWSSLFILLIAILDQWIHSVGG